MSGSSPRMRGAPTIACVKRSSLRFIPAHAGSTGPATPSVADYPVHPRACGEHERRDQRYRHVVGSSPRMRGAPARGCCRYRRRRFIPAHAGSTPVQDIPQGPTPVHPRACGEHTSMTRLACRVPGSSPRMRGAQYRHACNEYGTRFIPAHAGSTLSPGCRPGTEPVHPRACGEHSSDPRSSVRRFGSSPRMRGALEAWGRHHERHRFIPAHAGSTRCRHSSGSPAPVHPRACGEHPRRKVRRRPASGSSPRMRGARDWQPENVSGYRFIPAHAGSTDRGFCVVRTCPVHPRACGEHHLLAIIVYGVSGSSPRMRGAHVTGGL